MRKPEYKAYDDPERLKELYHGAGMTQRQIAKKFGVSQTTIRRYMKRYDISTRNSQREHSKYEHVNGYPVWRSSSSSTTNTVYIHQLLVIAEGADPHKVFSDSEFEVHHKNGVKWDNRPENVKLLSQSEHRQIHVEREDYGSQKKYTDQDMLDWIDAYVENFGHVPTSNMVEGWPGPSLGAYYKRFGSFAKARRKAGWADPDHTRDSNGRIVKYDEPKRIAEGENHE